MTTEYSSSQLISFADRGMLDKVDMADLLAEEPRSTFLAACAKVEREYACLRGARRLLSTRGLCARGGSMPRIRDVKDNVPGALYNSG